MRIHWLQHVPFEGLGTIATWLETSAHHVGRSRLFAGDPLPEPEDFDMLIVMGGPMGVGDEADYPWLGGEKQLLSRSVAAGKIIFGVCLGAQLLANALGAAVGAGEQREIGWFGIERAGDLNEPLRSLLPGKLKVLHWHGDTFAIPEGAVRLYSSAACRNQAFLAGTRMLGLQFHLEIGRVELEPLIAACADELVPGPWVQEREALLTGDDEPERRRNLLFALLDHLAARQR